MATIKAGTDFPTELVTEMFDAVVGHSALAKLSDEKPMPFGGVTEFVFSATSEAQLVGEGDPKAPSEAAVDPVVIKPVKFVFQQRVSDEFVYCGDEKRLRYLEAFAEGFSRKIARGFDIAGMHGLEPSTMTTAASLASNNFDGLVSNVVTLGTGTTIADDMTMAIALLKGADCNGIAFSPAAGTALAAISENGVSQYPEFRFGQNPDAFYGMKSDVNSTVLAAKTGDHPDAVILGDFQNAFKWGYVENIPLEVIKYGDPDGSGHDLRRYNEVCLRAEAFIGWGILNPDAFAIVRTA